MTTTRHDKRQEGITWAIYISDRYICDFFFMLHISVSPVVMKTGRKNEMLQTPRGFVKFHCLQLASVDNASERIRNE
jgi:hypothetical protein